MKKLLHLFAFMALLFVSCEMMGLNEPSNDIKDVNGKKIATIEEQMAAIEQSIPALRDVVDKAEELAYESENATRGNDNNNNGVKTLIAELEERIAALEEYINGGGSGEWTDVTYATMEMYEETVAILASLQAEVETLKEQYNTLCGAVSTAINEGVDSMKSWVNELLTGYYDIATVDAMFASLLEELTSADAEIIAEIESLRNKLDEELASMQKAYEDAIKSAIEENGLLDEKLTKAINDVNSRIDEEVAKLNKRLDDIEERLTKLEGSVSDLLKRIQSVAYVPIYEDGNARVTFPNDGTYGATLQLDFMISPKDAASDLAKVYKEAVSVQVLYTGSPLMTAMPIISCEAVASQGLFSVVCACDDISMEFYDGDITARAIMYISDGNNDRTSEYITIVPNRTQIQNNQIWYTVSNKLPVEIKQGSGPRIVSNEYDSVAGCYVVTFESDIYTIPTSYFSGCRELTSLTLPNSVRTIEANAFASCYGFKTISLGNSLNNIGSRAFEYSGISSLALPSTLSAVAYDTFFNSNISRLEGECVADDGISLILDNTLVAIAPAGIGAVYSVPAEAEAIGYGVFRDFNSIEQFSGKFATEDGYALVSNGILMVFAKACGIDEYTIPADITHIEDRVFANCTNISLFRFESTTPPTLGETVFDGIDNLQISIPVEAVEAYLTCDWPYEYRRAIIELADINNIPDSRRLDYTTNDNQKLNVYPEDGRSVLSHTYVDGQGMVVFFEPLTTIGDWTFGNCSSLTSVTIPDSVTTIGNYAFYDCDSLTSVTIGDSVTKIGDYAFYYCESLTSVTIPDSVTSIGHGAFAGCSSLTSITIPDSVTTIGDCAFLDCRSLTSVTIPDSVTTIGSSAFSDCSSLTSVTIPDSVTTIGDSAFRGCSRLTSVTIPDSVTTIGDYAFENCNNLTSITIPDSVTSIGYYAFYGCSSLTSVYISDIAAWCNISFSGSYSSPLYYANNLYLNNELVTDLTIPDSVTTIGGGAFWNCESLTSITIPDSVTEIGGGAFYGCSSFTSITIPDSVTEIGNCAFSHCSSLTSVTIGDSVTTIGFEAFKNCSSLTSVYCKAITPPSLGGTDVFDYNNSGRKIYVPTESVEAYMSVSRWSEYASAIFGYNF